MISSAFNLIMAPSRTRKSTLQRRSSSGTLLIDSNRPRSRSNSSTNPKSLSRLRRYSQALSESIHEETKKQIIKRGEKRTHEQENGKSFNNKIEKKNSASKKNDNCSSLLPITKGEAEQYKIMEKMYDYILALPKEETDPNEAGTCFHSESIPDITFSEYLERLVHYGNEYTREEPGRSSTGIRCAVYAIALLEMGKVKLSSYSIHRIFITAFLIALKMTDDYPISNDYFSKVAGCSIQDLNRMEKTFCFNMKWNLRVSEDIFEDRLLRFLYESDDN